MATAGARVLQDSNALNQEQGEPLVKLTNEARKQFNSFIREAKALELDESASPEDILKLYKKALKHCPDNEKLQKKVSKLEKAVASVQDENEVEKVEESEPQPDGYTFVEGGCTLPGGFKMPRDIYDNLLPFQREGVRWMWNIHRTQTGAILGDDMGLGKTVQICALLAGLPADGKYLIAAPVSVLANWTEQLKKWTKALKVFTFHQIDAGERAQLVARMKKKPGVLITTYGTITTSAAQLGSVPWTYVILDEGHKIKNPSRQISKAVRAIVTKHRLLVTGTAIQNNLHEMWSLFDYVTDGNLFGSYPTFKGMYERPIVAAMARDATDYEKQLGQDTAKKLHAKIAPFFLRREKATIIKTRSVMESAPATAISMEESFVLPDSARVRDGEDDEDDEKEKDEEGNKLKRAASDPSAASTSAAAPPSQALDVLPRKNDIVVWLKMTDFQIRLYQAFLQSPLVATALNSTQSPLAALNVLKTLCDHPALFLGDRGMAAANTNHLITDPKVSTKLIFLETLLYNLSFEGHRVLIFSQSRRMLDFMESQILHKEKYKFLRIDGTVTSAAERQRRIDLFNKDESYFCFLLTTQTGGLGITLTGANRAVIVDPQWNPAGDAQAVDRIYRIGQKRNVLIYRLITCGTIEEKIYRKQVFKDTLVKAATQKGSHFRYFTRDELRDLFTLHDPTRSQTQELLASMHTASRDTDETLEAHLGFVCDITGTYGVSDHNLLFSVEAEEIEQIMEEVDPVSNKKRRPHEDGREPKEPTKKGKRGRKGKDEDDGDVPVDVDDAGHERNLDAVLDIMMTIAQDSANPTAVPETPAGAYQTPALTRVTSRDASELAGVRTTLDFQSVFEDALSSTPVQSPIRKASPARAATPPPPYTEVAAPSPSRVPSGHVSAQDLPPALAPLTPAAKSTVIDLISPEVAPAPAPEEAVSAVEASQETHALEDGSQHDSMPAMADALTPEKASALEDAISSPEVLEAPAAAERDAIPIDVATTSPTSPLAVPPHFVDTSKIPVASVSSPAPTAPVEQFPSPGSLAFPGHRLSVIPPDESRFIDASSLMPVAVMISALHETTVGETTLVEEASQLGEAATAELAAPDAVLLEAEPVVVESPAAQLVAPVEKQAPTVEDQAPTAELDNDRTLREEDTPFMEAESLQDAVFHDAPEALDVVAAPEAHLIEDVPEMHVETNVVSDLTIPTALDAVAFAPACAEVIASPTVGDPEAVRETSVPITDSLVVEPATESAAAVAMAEPVDESAMGTSDEAAAEHAADPTDHASDLPRHVGVDPDVTLKEEEWQIISSTEPLVEQLIAPVPMPLCEPSLGAECVAVAESVKVSTCRCAGLTDVPPPQRCSCRLSGEEILLYNHHLACARAYDEFGYALEALSAYMDAARVCDADGALLAAIAIRGRALGMQPTA